MSDQPTCGRCGVYRHLHPTTRCVKPRLSWWWDRHHPIRHVAGILWLALPEKARWRIVGAIYDRRPGLCWCDLVDAAYLEAKADDYRGHNGCGCDVPLPTDARAPRYGFCYCQPPPTHPAPTSTGAGTTRDAQGRAAREGA